MYHTCQESPSVFATLSPIAVLANSMTNGIMFIMKRLEVVGLSLALSFGSGACADNGQHQAKKVAGGIVVTAEQNNVVLLAEQNILKSQLGDLKAGRKVVAVCFSESASLAMDSIKVSAGLPVDRNVEYAFVGHRNAEGDIIPNFNVSPAELSNQLPSC